MRSLNISGPKVTTVDATANVVILTYNIPNNTGICARVMISGRDTVTNKTANCIVAFAAQNQAGTAAIIGTPTPTSILTFTQGSDQTEFAGLPVATIGFTGGQVQIRVTGIAATTIQWQASMEVLGGD